MLRALKSGADGASHEGKAVNNAAARTNRGAELRWLASALKTMAPGQYRDLAVASARGLLQHPLATESSHPLDRDDRDNLFGGPALYPTDTKLRTKMIVRYWKLAKKSLCLSLLRDCSEPDRATSTPPPRGGARAADSCGWANGVDGIRASARVPAGLSRPASSAFYSGASRVGSRGATCPSIKTTFLPGLGGRG